MSTPAPESAAPDGSRLPAPTSSSSSVPALLLLAWLVLAVPMFLRMPETNDAEMFDLQAWLVRDGGVLYRDVLEPNLPGVVWLHLLVRSVAGSSSEALRAFDLLSFAVLLCVLFRLLKKAGSTTSGALWTVLGCSVFYLSTSEWCHCQRDMWMLTPAMAGVWLRLKQRERAESDGGRMLVLWGLAEGLVWGVGIWIKPHVLLVTIAAWLCSLSRAAGFRRTLFDALGLLAGGALAGGAGFAWLCATGAWPHLLDTMLNWNPRYLEAGRENWTFDRFKSMFIRLAPWFLLHAVAVPISLKRVWLRVSGADATRDHAAIVSAVLASVYLVWMGHSFLLQHLFDYVHAPAIVLAIAVCAVWFARLENRSIARAGVILFCVAVVATSGLLKPKSLPVWRECVLGESSPELQDRLTHFDNPRRTDLTAIAEFLRDHNVRDKDVLFFNSDGVSLYRKLNLTPPSRYVYFFETLKFFPDRQRDVILEAMASRPRFIVLDLVSCGPMKKSSFPLKYPVVFRSGSWRVLEVRSE